MGRLQSAVQCFNDFEYHKDDVLLASVDDGDLDLFQICKFTKECSASRCSASYNRLVAVEMLDERMTYVSKLLDELK